MIPPAAAVERLVGTGRTRVADLLPAAEATALHALLDHGPVDWQRAIETPGDVEVPVALFEAQPIEEQIRIMSRVHAEARDGFQFIFDRWRIDVGGQASPAAPALLADLHRRFNSPEFLAFARALTGDDRIAYVDAQATRFLPGHFLNRHSDQLDRAGRLYAYVLNLCPRWRVEWGGLLQFLDDEGDVTETLTPGFNTLNLFRVPQPHAVSMVSPFAGAPRLSITGWWRAFPPEPVT
ncbi:MAG: 2OG-Fe(II) oxygenase [Brevundimonas sp.]|uniref:2OG-Fe(II) oxygenase n=1 Tax=Brevundimonas sp. TaxID=1871086 RepID=UPI00391A8443